MGNTAENVVARYGAEFNLTRAEMDKFGLESNIKAAKAIAEGRFDSQVVPVPYHTYKNGKRIDGVFKMDEGPRADTTLEAMAALKPAFKVGGSVTAANSSQMNDAAAYVLMMSADEAKKRGLEILAYFRNYQVEGVRADEMGVGPAAAIPKLLARSGVKLEEIDIFELNEAFASQALYSIRKLGIDIAKVNPNGGAIALGHPLGCTGAKLTTQLVHELKRTGKRYGIVSMCIGGGMGAAGLFERPQG